MSMQLLAMITMLIDHIGIVFYPDDERFRVLGRLAFPLYAYTLVLGYIHTRNLRNYVIRLTVIAAISQLPYQLALGESRVNVVGTLIVCLLVLWAIDRYSLPAGIAIICLAALLLETLPFSYGVYALALVLIYRYARSYYVVIWHLLLNVLFLFYKGWFTQLASLFASVILVYMIDVYRLIDRINPPRWVWRSFYPVHLAALACLELIIFG
jgi:hypothetical protein